MRRVPGPIVARGVVLGLVALAAGLGAVWSATVLPRPETTGQWVILLGTAACSVIGGAWAVFRLLPDRPRSGNGD